MSERVRHGRARRGGPPALMEDLMDNLGGVVSGAAGWAAGLLPLAGARSRLMEIGLQAGFSAGVTLDHIYRGAPIGSGLWGRHLDRWLLARPAARDLRERARVVVAEVRGWVAQTAAASGGGDARRLVLDVGAGSGWLLREALLGCTPAGVRGLRVVHAEIAGSVVDVRATRVMLAGLAASGPGGAPPPSGEGDNDALARAVSMDLFRAFPRDTVPLVRGARLVLLSGVLGMEPDDGAVADALGRLAEVAADDAALIVTHPIRYGGDWTAWSTRLVPPSAASPHRQRFGVNPRRQRRGWAGTAVSGYREVGGGRPVVQRSLPRVLSLLGRGGWRVDTVTPVGDGGGREPRFVVVRARRAGPGGA